MAYLRGTGLGQGMALGTTAIVRMRSGFPLMPKIPPRIAELLTRHKLDETPDVILVADDYRMALDIARSLRWGQVVGIAAGETPGGAAISHYPSVINVEGLLDSVEDDMLMIVDADQGIIVVDPDGMAVAQYQAERDKIAPRRRLFLDEGHLPAETIDGRMVMVPGYVETLEDAALALETGADLLYVPFSAPVLPSDVDEITQRQNLLDLIESASGKSILLADDYSFPPMLLLEACLRAEITLAEPVVEHLDGLGLGEFAEELNEAQAECLANEMHCALPHLAFGIESLTQSPLDESERLPELLDRWAARGATRIVLGFADEKPDKQTLLALDNLIAAANANMLPVFVIVPDLNQVAVENLDEEEQGIPSAIGLLVGSGVSGLIVKPADVQTTKVAIRNLNFSECREAVTELLTQSSPHPS